MKTITLFAIGGVVALVAAGCSTYKPVVAPAPAAAVFPGEVVVRQPSADLLRPASDPFTLGAGDRIEVEIMGDPATRETLTVGPDGKIYYHLLRGVDVSGLTLRQARERLEKELAEFVREPQLSVNLRDIQSKHVWLMGRVGQPGIYPLTAPTTLIEAMTLAGGTSQSDSLVTTEELADLRHSFVLRGGELLPVDFQRLLRDGDMRHNIYLRPDDFVFVPSSLTKDVYVLGAVRAPMAVGYRDNLTLIAAISSSGGLIPKLAHGKHVAIVRGSLAQPTVTLVDCEAIMRGTAPDVLLEPHDIIYVPDSPYRTLNRYVEMVVNTFVGTIAANEGIRAIDPNGVGVGINVPIGGSK